MGIEGWYYLHENGDLIYKRELGGTAADIRDSPLARGLWPVDPTDRAGAWDILVEALAAGADKGRVMALADKWGCTEGDAQVYGEVRGVNLQPDGNAMCATRMDFISLQESPAGFGDSSLEAMAELCRELGYVPAKMWGKGFADLLT